MGAKITLPEMIAKTDQEILDYKEDVIKDMKPEVRAKFDERKAEIQARQAAGGGAAAAQAPAAAPTPPPAAPAEEVKADPAASAAA
jgi:hypothetical protein